MTDNQEILVYVDDDNKEEAKFMSRNFVKDDIRSRAYINALGSEMIIKYLVSEGANTSDVRNLHSISRILELVDISDILLSNIHIDVRTIFDKNEIFIPKRHFELGLVPDIYVVIKFDENLEKAEILGYFEPKSIEFKHQNDEYYFVEKEQLVSAQTLWNFIQNYSKTNFSDLTDEEFEKGRELAISMADHDISDENLKEFFNLALRSQKLRDAIMEFDNFETLSYNVAPILANNEDRVITIKDSSAEDEENANYSNDYNGDDMLGSGDSFFDEETGEAVSIKNGDESKEKSSSGLGVTSEVIGDAIKTGIAAAGATAATLSAAEMAKASVTDDAMHLINMSDKVIDDIISKNLDDQHENLNKIDFNKVKFNEKNEISDEMLQNMSINSENIKQEEQNIELKNLGEFKSQEEAEEEEVIEQETVNFGDMEQIKNEFMTEDFDLNPSNNNDDNQIDNDEDDIFENAQSEQMEKNVEENVEEFLDENLVELDKEDFNEVGINEETLGDIENQFDNLLPDESSENEILNSEEEIFDNSSNEENVENPEIADDILMDELGEQDVAQDVILDDITDATQDDIPIDDDSIFEQFSDESQEQNQESDEQNETTQDIEALDEGIIDDEILSDDILPVSEQDLTLEEDIMLDEDVATEKTEEQEAVLDDSLSEGILNESIPVDGIDDLSEESIITDDSADSEEVVNEVVPDDVVADDVVSEDVTSDTVIQDDIHDEYNTESETFDSNEENTKEDESSETSDDPVAEYNETDDMKVLLGEDTSPQSNDNEQPAPEDVNFDESSIIENENFDAQKIDEENIVSEPIGVEDLSVVENRTVISNKQDYVGEIPIDINYSEPKMMDGPEQLEHLYDISEDDNRNNSVLKTPAEFIKGAKPPVIMGVAGLIIVVAIIGIIGASVNKFMKKPQSVPTPMENTSVPENVEPLPQNPNAFDVNNDNVVNMEENNAPIVPNAQQPQAQAQPAAITVTNKPVSPTAFVDVKKLSWEIPDYVAYNPDYKYYLNSAGKSLRLSLKSDLLLATEYPYSSQAKVSVSFNKEGKFIQSQIVTSSGSSQIDKIVLRTVNQTLNVLKAPHSIGNDESTTVILKINF